MLVYPSGVDACSSTVRFLAQHQRRRRRAIGSRWRRLSARRQALPTLAHLRGHTYAQLAAGFVIGTTTAHRYVTEAIDLLAALAPTLAQGHPHRLDKGLRPARRHAPADRPHPRHSGKHKKHGMNVQVLTDPFGRVL